MKVVRNKIVKDQNTHTKQIENAYIVEECNFKKMVYVMTRKSWLQLKTIFVFVEKLLYFTMFNFGVYFIYLTTMIFQFHILLSLKKLKNIIHAIPLGFPSFFLSDF